MNGISGNFEIFLLLSAYQNVHHGNRSVALRFLPAYNTTHCSSVSGRDPTHVSKYNRLNVVIFWFLFLLI